MNAREAQALKWLKWASDRVYFSSQEDNSKFSELLKFIDKLEKRHKSDAEVKR